VINLTEVTIQVPISGQPRSERTVSHGGVTTRRSRQQQSEDLFVTVTVVIEGCGVSRVTVSKNLWNGTIVLPQAVFCVMCYAPRRGERGLMLQLCATRAEGIACSAQQAELVID
jgi:hypothetical protein